VPARVQPGQVNIERDGPTVTVNLIANKINLKWKHIGSFLLKYLICKQGNAHDEDKRSKPSTLSVKSVAGT
jgi:hypothetical protein